MPNYTDIHQIRKHETVDGVCMFSQDSLFFKLGPALSINDESIEASCVQVINKKQSNILVNTQYRQPAGQIKQNEKCLKNFFKKIK